MCVVRTVIQFGLGSNAVGGDELTRPPHKGLKEKTPSHLGILLARVSTLSCARHDSNVQPFDP